MKKIRDVFDVLFGITKTKEDIGDEPTPTANANLKLTAQATRIEVGKDLEIRATASSGDGTYAQGSIKFSIENSTVARFTNNNLNEDTANIITIDFQNGLATAKIKGINKGKTEIIAVSKIDDKDLSDKITIEVIESPSILSTTTAIL